MTFSIGHEDTGAFSCVQLKPISAPKEMVVAECEEG
jgi:hypothetical protein